MEPRCKVYALLPDGSWKDSGTGFASAEAAAPATSTSVMQAPWRLCVRDSEGTIVWEQRLSPGDSLQRQQGTMIAWATPDESEEASLSFQESSGCQRVWTVLCAAVGMSPSCSAVRIPAAASGCCCKPQDRSAEGGVVPEPVLLTAPAAAVATCVTCETRTSRDKLDAPRFSEAVCGSSPDSDNSSDSDSDGEDDARRAEPSPSAALAGQQSRAPASLVRRRVTTGSGSLLSVSSALELFGLRSGSGAGANVAHPRSALQPLRAPTSFSLAALDAAAEATASRGASGGTSAALSLSAPWRLAQLDARSLPPEDAGANENACAPAETPRAFFDAHGHTLPTPRTLEDVPALADALQEAFSSGFMRKRATKEFLASREATETWLPGLFALLSVDNNDIPVSVLLAFGTIVKLLLAQEDLFDALLSDALFPSFLTVLERVLGAPAHSFEERFMNVQFRQIEPLNNAALVAKVHHCFRLSFLRDHVLPRHYDDVVFSLLSSAVASVQVAVLSAVTADTTMLRKIIELIYSHRKSGFSGAADQYRLRAGSVLKLFPSLLSGRISGAAVLHAFHASADAALACSGCRSTREECLCFLNECLTSARGQLQARGAFLLSLSRACPQLFSALESVLADRHATLQEVSITLDVLQAYASDAQVQQQLLSQPVSSAYVAARGGGLTGDPLRRYLASQAKAAWLKDAPQPSTKTSPQPCVVGCGGSGGGERRACSIGELLQWLLNSPCDDGASIRPYEKVLTVACTGQLPADWLQLPWPELTESVTMFNSLRAPYGEHGTIVPSPTEQTGLLAALVWRAVDDPEPSVNVSSLELLRSLLDLTVSEGPDVTQEDISRTVQAFYDHFASWLVQPFCSSHLAPLITMPDPKLAASLLSCAVTAPSDKDRSALVDKLCPWFRDARVGAESSLSKQSKQAIVDHLLLCLKPHGFRVKYLQLRQKVFTRMLRLLAYPEKHLSVLAVQAMKSVVGGDDDFYRNSLMGEFALSPLFASAILRAGKRDALESALLDCLASLKGQVVADALRGPYKNVNRFLDGFASKVLQVAAESGAERSSLLPLPSAPEIGAPLRGPIASRASRTHTQADVISGAALTSSGPLKLDADLEYFESDDLDVEPRRVNSPPSTRQSAPHFSSRPVSPSLVAEPSQLVETVARTPPARQADPFSFDYDEAAAQPHVATSHPGASESVSSKASSAPAPNFVDVIPAEAKKPLALTASDESLSKSSFTVEVGTALPRGEGRITGGALWAPTSVTHDADVEPWSESLPARDIASFGPAKLAADSADFGRHPILGPSASKRQKLAVLLRNPPTGSNVIAVADASAPATLAVANPPHSFDATNARGTLASVAAVGPSVTAIRKCSVDSRVADRSVTDGTAGGVWTFDEADASLAANYLSDAKNGPQRDDQNSPNALSALASNSTLGEGATADSSARDAVAAVAATGWELVES